MSWDWTVRQTDGRVVAEHASDGDHGWAEVESDKVESVMLGGQPTFALERSDGGWVFRIGGEGLLYLAEATAHPLFFRRHTSPWVNAGGPWCTLHCLGVERADGTGVYLFWDDDGRTLFTPDKQVVPETVMQEGDGRWTPS